MLTGSLDFMVQSGGTLQFQHLPVYNYYNIQGWVDGRIQPRATGQIWPDARAVGQWTATG